MLDKTLFVFLLLLSIIGCMREDKPLPSISSVTNSCTLKMSLIFDPAIPVNFREKAYAENFDAASKYFIEKKVPVRGTSYSGLDPVSISWDLSTDCQKAEIYLNEFTPYLAKIDDISRVDMRENLLLNIYYD